MTELAEAHARLLHDGLIQTRFPAPPPAPAIPDIKVPNLGHAPVIVFWTLVAGIVIAIGIVLIRHIGANGLPRWSRKPRPTGPEVEKAAQPAPLAIQPDEDRLAEAGDYGPAVHALLLRCVACIRERFPRLLLPAHTSRDIAALPALPPALAQSFATIVAPTERTVFAGQPIGRAEWEACRASSAAVLGTGATRP